MINPNPGDFILNEIKSEAKRDLEEALLQDNLSDEDRRKIENNLFDIRLMEDLRK